MNTEPTACAQRIAEQLSEIYCELVERRPFSDVAQVPLTEAGSSGQALRLFILQCDTNDLTMRSVMRQWWVVDGAGLHAGGEWPLSSEMISTPSSLRQNPYVKFAMNGHRVRFGMHFGWNWYVSREGPIGADGRFIADDLIDVSRRIRPEPVSPEPVCRVQHKGVVAWLRNLMK